MPKWTPPEEGVNWGTEVVPKEFHIDPSKPYRTRGGCRVEHIQIKLQNDCGNEVTFPVKGSIDRGYRKRRRYAIWTLDGRSQVVGGRHGDDLVCCDFTREDFSYEASSTGYMLKFRGRNLGGAGLKPDPDRKMHWRHARQNAKDFAEQAEREIQAILDARIQPRFWPIILEVLDGSQV